MDPSRPSREVQNIQVQNIPNNIVDCDNADLVFATKFYQAVQRRAELAWTSIDNHILKNERVKSACRTVRVHVTNGKYLKPLAIAGGILGTSYALKNLGEGVTQLGAYNKTFTKLTNEAVKLNTIFNSTAKGFIEDFRNKTASLESIAKNVTAMADNKTDVFFHTTATFLTEIGSFNSKVDTFNSKLDMFNNTISSKLDMFNNTISSKLDMFNRILMVMVFILLCDRVSELDSAPSLCAHFQAYHMRVPGAGGLALIEPPPTVPTTSPRSSANPLRPSQTSAPQGTHRSHVLTNAPPCPRRQREQPPRPGQRDRIPPIAAAPRRASHPSRPGAHAEARAPQQYPLYPCTPRQPSPLSPSSFPRTTTPSSARPLRARPTLRSRAAGSGPRPAAAGRRLCASAVRSWTAL